jgi:hypothetical protein
MWVQWAMPVPTFAVVIPFAFTAAWFSLLLAAATIDSVLGLGRLSNRSSVVFR